MRRWLVHPAHPVTAVSAKGHADAAEAVVGLTSGLGARLGFFQRSTVAPRQSAGLLGTSANAQHSFLESTLMTRHPPEPSLWAHRFMAPLSASSLLGSLTRAKIPPFFSTTTPQQEALAPHVAPEAEPAKIATLIAVTGLSRTPGAN